MIRFPLDIWTIHGWGLLTRRPYACAVTKRMHLYCKKIVYRYTGINNNNNSKRPLTPKSMPPAGDEHAKLKT